MRPSLDPDLDALVVRIVHQKQVRLGFFGQVVIADCFWFWSGGFTFTMFFIATNAYFTGATPGFVLKIRKNDSKIPVLGMFGLWAQAQAQAQAQALSARFSCPSGYKASRCTSMT